MKSENLWLIVQVIAFFLLLFSYADAQQTSAPGAYFLKIVCQTGCEFQAQTFIKE